MEISLIYLVDFSYNPLAKCKSLSKLKLLD
jgi:hypothetical protein